MSTASADENRDLDESVPLLNRQQDDHRVPAHISSRLYISHFLSTWNSRVFEFGAVLYLATIFPGTLLPLSVYALTRGLSAIVFSSSVGSYIDSGNRLNVVRLSIVLQRLAVAASCAIFYTLTFGVANAGYKIGLLALATVLACVEKLCSIMNLISVEKDWVVVVAADDSEALKILNAQMRRIDLLCKLIGPLVIALLDGISTQHAILINFGMNAASVVIEYYGIAQVYNRVPALHEPKRAALLQHQERVEGSQKQPSIWQHTGAMLRKSLTDFRFYIHHRTFLPSFAGALLYLTVLSFAGQMVTYLLSAGYSSTQIGAARTLSVGFEVLATWVAPSLIGAIGPIRAGLWLSAWQLTMLVGGTAVFLGNPGDPLISATGLVGGTMLSRLGLRGFDLCVQLLTQEDVEAESRGAFSSTEAAWQNMFEMLSYMSTIVFFRPDQFKWPTLISVGAVGMASSAYAAFVYQRRGHLLHLEALTNCLGTSKAKQRERERGIERITSRPDM